jgi:hypothetical protein
VINEVLKEEITERGNKIGNVYYSENAEVPKVFFTPVPVGVIIR